MCIVHKYIHIQEKLKYCLQTVQKYKAIYLSYTSWEKQANEIHTSESVLISYSVTYHTFTMVQASLWVLKNKTEEAFTF